MKSLSQFALLTLCCALPASFLAAPLFAADAKKPKYTIKEVMKEVHKGEDNIGKRVANGTASKEDIAKMVAHYESLPLNEPPRGDKESWAAKTSKLVAASKAVQSGAPNAAQLYKDATNCKACHSAHKPEDKK